MVFLMENTIKMDDLGGKKPLFWATLLPRHSASKKSAKRNLWEGGKPRGRDELILKINAFLVGGFNPVEKY